MREAILYEKLPDKRVRCHVCSWHCTINEGKFGVCRTHYNSNGTLFALNYAQVSSMAVDPIEKKPLFHFYPKSLVFSLGGWGCNFHCLHCQNHEISMTTPWNGGYGSRKLTPEELVELAKRYKCEGIAWTYNEPGIWLEYTLEGAKLAKKEGLYTVYVTNGFLSEEALDLIGPYLDAFRVDVKGFRDEFYMRLCRVKNWRKVLDITKRAKDKWGMHIEVVTNIIPGWNDSDEELRDIARWIRDELSPLIPWHITRFYPHHKLSNLPPTPISTLEKAYRIGKEEGLKFIYIGNVPGHEFENTYCYSCGKKVVERYGYSTEILGLSGSKCKFCGSELYFRTGR